MDQLASRLDDLAAELRATEELPVERSAARWIGEAEVVAVDLTRSDPDADERVAAAKATAADILDQCCE